MSAACVLLELKVVRITLESTPLLEDDEDACEDGPLLLNAEDESSDGQGDSFMYFSKLALTCYSFQHVITDETL